MFLHLVFFFFFFKQKTAYEMRISDWSSDVCSSDLGDPARHDDRLPAGSRSIVHAGVGHIAAKKPGHLRLKFKQHLQRALRNLRLIRGIGGKELATLNQMIDAGGHMVPRSEEHTSELQSLMRISYAVFCLKKKTKKTTT